MRQNASLQLRSTWLTQERRKMYDPNPQPWWRVSTPKEQPLKPSGLQFSVLGQTPSRIPFIPHKRVEGIPFKAISLQIATPQTIRERVPFKSALFTTDQSPLDVSSWESLRLRTPTRQLPELKRTKLKPFPYRPAAVNAPPPRPPMRCSVATQEFLGALTVFLILVGLVFLMWYFVIGTHADDDDSSTDRLTTMQVMVLSPSHPPSLPPPSLPPPLPPLPPFSPETRRVLVWNILEFSIEMQLADQMQ